MNQTNAESTDPIASQITAAMRHTNENNPLHPRVCFEDRCPFNQVVRRQRDIESIRIAFENGVPNHPTSGHCLQLANNTAHAVANEDHALGYA